MCASVWRWRGGPVCGPPMSSTRSRPTVSRPRSPGVADVSRVQAILKSLHAARPGARVELDHNSPFQLLIATILSAQCTDERVNNVTPALFRSWPDAAALARAPLAGI